MKVITSIILILTITFICYACGKTQGNPIKLPVRDEVVSIDVSDGEKRAFSSDAEGEADAFIDEFYSILLNMEATGKESVNDAPVNKDYITIDINCPDSNTTTLFYYKDKGTEYVEQPYQGIYKPSPALGLRIAEMLDTSDNKATGSGEPLAGGAVLNPSETLSDMRRMVKIKGKLYYDAGKVDDNVTCGTPDGYITSSVAQTEIPNEDGQSNFGTDYAWQYSKNENEKVLHIGDKWVIFKTEE